MRSFARISLISLASTFALSALAETGSDSLAFEARLREARRRVHETRTEGESAKAASDALVQERATLEARVVTDGRTLYRLSRSGLLPVVAGFDGLVLHASRVERLERMVRADLDSLNTMEHRAAELGQADKRAQELAQHAADTLRSIEREQAEFVQRMTEQRATAQNLVEPGSGAVDTQRLGYGISASGTRAASKTSFTEQRGDLALPVSGPSEIREAKRAESEGPGLEFVAGRGAAVRAVAEGRVAFADRYGSYGTLVIVDHGNRYYTVYGGFGGLDVQVGDEVSKSARLGTAGSDPIYFEVRRGTKTESARLWLGL